MRSTLDSLIGKPLRRAATTAILGLYSLAGFSQDAQGTIDFDSQNFDLEGKEITVQAQFGTNEEFTFTLDADGKANYNLPLDVLSADDDDFPIGEIIITGNPARATNVYTQLDTNTIANQVQAKVYSIDGKLISNVPVELNAKGVASSYVDLSTKAEGAYVYTLITPNGTFSERIINAGPIHAKQSPSDNIFSSITSYNQSNVEQSSRGRGSSTHNYTVTLPSGFGFVGQTNEIELALGNNADIVINADELALLQASATGNITSDGSNITEDAIVTRTNETTSAQDMVSASSGTFSFPVESFSYDQNNNAINKMYSYDVESATFEGSASNQQLTPSSGSLELIVNEKMRNFTFNFTYPDSRPAQNTHLVFDGGAPIVLDATGSVTLNLEYGTHNNLVLQASDSSYEGFTSVPVTYTVSDAIGSYSDDIDGAVLPTILADYTQIVRDKSDSSPLEFIEVDVNGSILQTDGSGQAVFEDLQLANDEPRFWEGSLDLSVMLNPTENSAVIAPVSQNQTITDDYIQINEEDTFEEFEEIDQGQITNTFFSSNVSNAEITYRYLPNLALHNQTINSESNGSFNVTLHVDNDPMDLTQPIPTQYQRTIKIPTSGNAQVFIPGPGFVNFEFYTLIDTVTITEGSPGINNAAVIEPPQTQDLTVYTYNETTQQLLPSVNVILREKGTGTEMHNVTTDGNGEVTIEDIALNANGYYFDLSKTGFYGKDHEEHGFDTPTANYVFSDTVRSYINRALVATITDLTAAEINEMTPTTANIGMFLYDEVSDTTNSGIHLPEPSAAKKTAINSGVATLGWPNMRYEDDPGNTGPLVPTYHPVDNPYPGQITTNAEYTGTSTSPQTKTINLTEQSIDIIVYADPFRIGGDDVSTRKETLGRLYGFRDVSSRTSLMNTTSADIQPEDILIMNITRDNVLSIFKYQDGNGNPIEMYYTVPGSVQD